jgi:hypothetical protein
MDAFHEILFKTQLEALVTEREAMRAANSERFDNNQTIAYPEEAFQSLVGQFAALEDRIRNEG